MQFGGFCEFWSSSGGDQGSESELMVENWSSWLRIGAQGSELELMVENWSSQYKFEAHGSRFGVLVLDLELMAQQVSIMTSFFWACCDKGFWACNRFRVLAWMGMQPIQGFSFFGHEIDSGF